MRQHVIETKDYRVLMFEDGQIIMEPINFNYEPGITSTVIELHNIVMEFNLRFLMDIGNCPICGGHLSLLSTTNEDKYYCSKEDKRYTAEELELFKSNLKQTADTGWVKKGPGHEQRERSGPGYLYIEDNFYGK